MKKTMSLLLIVFAGLQATAEGFDRDACLAEEFEKLNSVVGMSQAGKMYEAEAICAAKQESSLIPELIRGNTEDIICGEIDPYAVGDACVVYTTDKTTGKKLGLVYDDYDWIALHIPEPDSTDDWIGEEFEASTCELIKDPNAISELKSLNGNSEYFFVNCYAYDFNWFYRLIDEL